MCQPFRLNEVVGTAGEGSVGLVVSTLVVGSTTVGIVGSVVTSSADWTLCSISGPETPLTKAPVSAENTFSILSSTGP